MKKQTQTLLLLAGAGALGYFLLKSKKSSARMIESEAESAESTETGKGAETMPEQPEVDAVIDTTKTGQTVRQAIQQGKELATALKDANIIIKTPSGQPNVAIKTGAKKPNRRQRIKAKREKLKAKRAERLKTRRKKRVEAKEKRKTLRSQRQAKRATRRRRNVI